MVSRAPFAILAIALLLASWPAAHAQEPGELPRLAALRATGDTVVDGRLDEACWREAPVTSAFHVLATRKHAPAPAEETRCQVVFDEQALVIGIVCREPRMSELIANATERDGAIWLDDSVEIFLQPSPAFYYHFGINNRGTLYDARVGVLADGTPGDQAEGRLWDGVWEAVVTRAADAWTVEVRIPFAALDLGPQTPSAWRFSVGRTAARRLEYSAWAPVVKGFHDLNCFGYLEKLDIAYSRFVVDGAGITFPALFVGRNRVQFALPVRGSGQFRVSSVLREWTPAATAPRFPPGTVLDPVQGVLPVMLDLPVAKGGVLHEATIAISEATTDTPLVLRAHLFKAPSPFAAALEWAVYYPSDGNVVAAVTLAVAPESARGMLRMRLVGDGMLAPRQSEAAITQPGVSRWPLSLAGLPNGFYRVVVSADLAGLGEYTEELRFYLTDGPFDGARPRR
jgi:hypothetical protein